MKKVVTFAAEILRNVRRTAAASILILTAAVVFILAALPLAVAFLLWPGRPRPALQEVAAPFALPRMPWRLASPG